MQIGTHQGFTPLGEKLLLKEAIEKLGRQPKESIIEESSSPKTEESNNLPLPLSKDAEANFQLDLAQFIIKNHLPFDVADELLEFIKYTMKTYNSSLVERCHTSSTSMQKTIKFCIGDILKEKIIKDLEESPYSLLIDGSSDILGGKFLAVLVRYLDTEDLPITKLLSVIEIGSLSTGEQLYQKIREIYNNNQKLKSNLIGFSTDNGSDLISGQGFEKS